MPRIDPKKFNDDPKHESERSEFDALVEGSMERIAKRRQANPPKKEEESGSILDEFFKGLGF